MCGLCGLNDDGKVGKPGSKNLGGVKSVSGELNDLADGSNGYLMINVFGCHLCFSEFIFEEERTCFSGGNVVVLSRSPCGDHVDEMWEGLKAKWRIVGASELGANPRVVGTHLPDLWCGIGEGSEKRGQQKLLVLPRYRTSELNHVGKNDQSELALGRVPLGCLFLKKRKSK